MIDTDLERDYLNGGEGDDSIHSYGAGVMTGGDGADTFVYTDVGDEPIEITDFDPLWIRWPFSFTKMTCVTHLFIQCQKMFMKFVWAIRWPPMSNQPCHLIRRALWFKRINRKLFANLRFFSIRIESVKTDSSKGLAGRHPGLCHNP